MYFSIQVRVDFGYFFASSGVHHSLLSYERQLGLFLALSSKIIRIAGIVACYVTVISYSLF